MYSRPGRILLDERGLLEFLMHIPDALLHLPQVVDHAVVADADGARFAVGLDEGRVRHIGQRIAGGHQGEGRDQHPVLMHDPVRLVFLDQLLHRQGIGADVRDAPLVQDVGDPFIVVAETDDVLAV